MQLLVAVAMAAVAVSSLSSCAPDDDAAGVAQDAESQTAEQAADDRTGDIGDDEEPETAGAADDDSDGSDEVESTDESTDGLEASDVDADQDGIADKEDNCPTEPNPLQDDICSEDPEPRGGCAAALFVARPAGLVQPLLIVEFTSAGAAPAVGDASEANAPGCDEGVPREVEPSDPRGYVVAELGDRIYVVIDDDSAGRPGGGVDVEGAALDETAIPTPVELDDDEIGAVLEGALAGDAAPSVAGILTADAERYLAASVWSKVVALNPDLPLAEGGGEAAP